MWNDLPDFRALEHDVATFKKNLKTYLFCIAFWNLNHLCVLEGVENDNHHHHHQNSDEKRSVVSEVEFLDIIDNMNKKAFSGNDSMNNLPVEPSATVTARFFPTWKNFSWAFTVSESLIDLLFIDENDLE